MDKKEFRDYVLYDVLVELDNVTTKNLFGGYGFYMDDIIFGAYIDDDAGTDGFWLKGDEEFGNEIIENGGKRFIYTGHKTRKETKMPYYHVPEEILEDREKITEWAQRAWNISKDL